MSLFGLFQISGSALTAERLRAEVATSNLANSETTRTPEGGPYQRRMVVFRSRPGAPFHLLLAGSLGEAGQPCNRRRAGHSGSLTIPRHRSAVMSLGIPTPMPPAMWPIRRSIRCRRWWI